MITENKYPTEPRELYGTSLDVKPVEMFNGLPVTNGSFFFEVDTTNVFVFDKESMSWTQV